MKWIALLIFGGVGLFLFVIGCVQGYQNYVLSRDGVTTQGHVVEVEIQEHDEGGDNRTVYVKRYYPVVEFQSAGEKQHRFTSIDGSRSVADYEVGGTVSVFYDPRNPAYARLADYYHAESLWVGPLVLALLGFMLLAIFGAMASFMSGDSFRSMSSDKTLGPEFHTELYQKQKSQMLSSLGGNAFILRGVVDSVRKQQGASGEEYVVLCWATVPVEVQGKIDERGEPLYTVTDGISQRFEAAPIFFNPEPWILGKSVEIYVDTRDKTRYGVMLEPVLAEFSKIEKR